MVSPYLVIRPVVKQYIMRVEIRESVLGDSDFVSWESYGRVQYRN